MFDIGLTSIPRHRSASRDQIAPVMVFLAVVGAVPTALHGQSGIRFTLP